MRLKGRLKLISLSLEADFVVAHFHGFLAQDIHHAAMNHLFGVVHHPKVVLVGHIDLKTREFGVVGAVHALVAEVARELVHALEAAHDEALQVELVGDTEVHRDVQGVVMCDERTCRSATGDGLQHRCLHLEIAALVEETADAVDDAGASDEDVLHLVVDHEVHVTHTVAQFGVVEFVILHAVFLLDDGQRPQRFAQHRQFLNVYRDFAHLRAEGEAFHADEVTNVQKALEDGVIHRLVLVGADLVALDIQLDAAL